MEEQQDLFYQESSSTPVHQLNYSSHDYSSSLWKKEIKCHEEETLMIIVILEVIIWIVH